MPGTTQSKRDKRPLDLRASVELIGVHPTAAGQPAARIEALPAKGKPSLTASVHMPAAGRRPLNLIREPDAVEVPSPAELTPAPKPELSRIADRLSPASAPKQDLFWDSLLSRPVASGSPSQPKASLGRPSAASNEKTRRPEDDGANLRAKVKRNLLVEALSPGPSASPEATVRTQLRVPRRPARSARAAALKPALKTAPLVKKNRKRVKRKPSHKRIWEAAEPLLLDGRVTTVVATAFAFVTGVAIFNALDIGPKFVPTRAVQMPTAVSEPVAAIMPRGASAIVDEPASWIGRLLRPIERRASKYIVDQFRDGLSDWTDSGPLQVVQGGLRVTSGLALRKSTLELDDYRFEFEAKAETGGIGWVVRAADEFDHYAFKFDTANRLKRYAVIGGQPQKATTIEAPAGLLKASGFNRILVQVKGERMMTMVNGLGVDFWKDRRIQRGGVGFIARDGDSALVRRMVLVANDDALGMVLNGAIETIRKFQDEPGARAAGPGISAGPVAFLIVKTPYRGPSIRPYGLLPRIGG